MSPMSGAGAGWWRGSSSPGSDCPTGAALARCRLRHRRAVEHDLSRRARPGHRCRRSIRPTGFLANARRYVRDPRAALRHRRCPWTLPVDERRLSMRAVSGLVLNFVPEAGAGGGGDAPRCRGPAARSRSMSGTTPSEMQMMRRFWDTAVALDPSAARLDEGARFPICRPEPLRVAVPTPRASRTWRVRAIDVPTVFRDFNDYWTPFLGGQAPAPGYDMSLSEDRALRSASACVRRCQFRATAASISSRARGRRVG